MVTKALKIVTRKAIWKRFSRSIFGFIIGNNFGNNFWDNFSDNSRVSNIESNNSQNVGLEDYNNISVGIFPHFTTPSIKISLG